MAGNFLAGDFLAYAVNFRDFLVGNFLTGYLLGGYPTTLHISLPKM